MKTRALNYNIKALKKKEGVWISSQEDLKLVFKDYYSNLFTPQVLPSQITHEDGIFNYLPSLNPTHLQILNQPFTDEEIKVVAFSPKPSKSLGPNGISPTFLQKNLDILGEAAIKHVKSFFSMGYLLKEQNKTFISPVPKVDRPQEVPQFRPINSLQQRIQNPLQNNDRKTSLS